MSAYPRWPRLAIAYLALQAMLVAGWWVALWRWPESRAPFVPSGWPEGVVLSFWLADLAVLVGGSAAAALGGARGRRWAGAVLAFVAGGAVYATLWCVAVGTMGGGWLPALLMLPCSGGTLACFVAVARRR